MRATKGKHTLDALRQQFCTIQNTVVFFRNYGVFHRFFFASSLRISPDATWNISVARTEGERGKSTSSGILFTSGFPVDRLRTCFLLSDVAGKNSLREDVRGTVKRAAIKQLGKEGEQQGVGYFLHVSVDEMSLSSGGWTRTSPDFSADQSSASPSHYEASLPKHGCQTVLMSVPVSVCHSGIRPLCLPGAGDDSLRLQLSMDAGKSGDFRLSIQHSSGTGRTVVSSQGKCGWKYIVVCSTY